MKLKWSGMILLVTFLLMNISGCQVQFPYVHTQNEPKAAVLSGKNYESNIKTVDISKIEKQPESIQQKIADYLNENHVNGSVAVIQNKNIIYNQGAGYSNLINKTPNGPATTYPIGSITKTFVATSIMQLQEQGKLNIMDPISKYIPHFPNGKKIRLINFLTHTSGIQGPIWHSGDRTHESLIREIERRPIKFAAGKRWDYMDANYMVLGYILEKVTGVTLHDYIQKYIFDKVPMQNSGFITIQHPVPYTSYGYVLQSGRIYPSDSLNIYLLFGCGDIYSTGLDLAKYDQALMNGELVSKNSLNMILKPGSPSKYGLGLYNVGYAAFSRGVIGGWNSVHVYYNNKTSIAVLLNILNRKSSIQQISTDIYQILQSENHPPIHPKSAA